MSSSFYYLAIDKAGKRRKGSINADNPKQARQLLRQKDLLPLTISKQPLSLTPSLSAYREFFSPRSIPPKTLCLVVRQLATLIKAGLPITEVLTAVSEQNSHLKTRTILLAVKAKVMEGHSLASALREHPNSFSPLYCGVVAAGEKTGNLAQVLERLAGYTEQQFTLKQKIIHALIYPSALILVSLCIIIFLLNYVVPKMISVYAHLNQALPMLTQILLTLSQGIKNAGIYMMLAGLAAYWAFRSLLQKKPAFREKYHLFLLRLPLLGSSIQTISTARYARTLSMLSSSGIPILEGMNTAAALMTSLPIRQALEEATLKVREGASIHLALKKTTYFSPLSLHLIESGEASGELESLLEHTARQQEEEITRLIDSLLTLFEPALILVMGGIVLFIVLAVLMPIFDLNQINM